MQLKEVSLNKGKESNSSRKDYAEKTHTIPFLHETSILNHQCERIHSSELENVILIINFNFYKIGAQILIFTKNNKSKILNFKFLEQT